MIKIRKISQFYYIVNYIVNYIVKINTLKKVRFFTIKWFIRSVIF